METTELSWIQSRVSPSRKVRLQLGLTQEVKYLPGDKGWVVRRASCPALQTCPVRPAVPSKIMGLALRGKHFCCQHNGSSVPHKLCYWKEREGESNTKRWSPATCDNFLQACWQLPECHAIMVILARQCMGHQPLQVPCPPDLLTMDTKAADRWPTLPVSIKMFVITAVSSPLKKLIYNYKSMKTGILELGVALALCTGAARMSSMKSAQCCSAPSNWSTPGHGQLWDDPTSPQLTCDDQRSLGGGKL